MERYEKAIKLLKWAKEHPQEWDIVCGLEAGGQARSLSIAESLMAEGFYELSLMLTLRVLQLRMEIEEME